MNLQYKFYRRYVDDSGHYFYEWRARNLVDYITCTRSVETFWDNA